MPARPEPHTVSHFSVVFDGVIDSPISFCEVTGLGAEVAVIEYRAGGSLTAHKLPGLARYSNIVLKRGITQDLTLWNWMRQILEGNVVRANGRIQLLNERREPVMTWRARNAFPTRYQGPEFRANGNDVAIETLELSHEGLEIES